MKKRGSGHGLFISLRVGQLAIVAVIPAQASDILHKRPTLTPTPSVSLSENTTPVVKMSSFVPGLGTGLLADNALVVVIFRIELRLERARG